MSSHPGLSPTDQGSISPRTRWIMIVLAAIGGFLVVEPLWVRGASLFNALLCVALIGSVGLLILPRARFGRVLMWSSIAAIIAVLLDLFGPSDRLPLTYQGLRLLLALALLIIFVILLARNFSSFDIRTKIVLGILVTGGAALGIFSFFVVAQAARLTSSLSERLETSVSLLAEEQLINTVNTQAEVANQAFTDVLVSVENLAQNWVLLQAQKNVLGQGQYWDAATGLSQLDGGQYGNSASDASSLFVPVGTTLSGSLIADMNTSAYLDFHAPAVLQENSSILAVYAIDTKGVTRYYPNIELATLLPPDFDATRRPYFQISIPLLNPRRDPRWTVPYVDAAGGGLVVTVASPVYVDDIFSGVVAGDMQLSKITEQISSVKVGQTGYAFMVDGAGRLLSMPPAGFELFEMEKKDVNSEDFLKATIIGAGNSQLKDTASRMVAGESGLIITNVGGIDYYVTFAPIDANDYSLAVVVPVEELQTAIIAARNETNALLDAGTKISAIILIGLLLISVLISLGIGQVISSPIVSLTQVSNQIVEGNLTAQANVSSSDEIGNLAEAFNTMTSRLRESLIGLEQRVEERSSELRIANERNERRARQFEAIAQIASTITTTRNLDTLLTQVTTAISSRFGFYHVGVFLLDSRREYAVLSAANSEGGQRMLARRHKLRVGETGIVGFVTQTGKPRIALNTGEDTVFFNNPDLPDTHSEIALPLLAEGVVIGALDVQSTQANAFNEDDVNILTTLADQVAVAIQNSRQYDATQRALAEADAISRQFVQSGWKQFTKSQNLIGVHHTGAKATLLYTNTGANKDDLRQPDFERTRNQRGSFISLPVKLRGETIGTVDVRSPDAQTWNQDDLDVVQAIIERAAIALENARLLAESQKRAAKERTIGEISAKISAQSDIDELLRTAAQELNRTLPGAEIAIQLNNNEEKQ